MRARPALTFALIAALCLALVAPAGADGERRRKSKVDNAIEDLRHALSETSAELRRAANALQQAESRLPPAQAKVAKVRGQLAAAQARDRLIAEQLAKAKTEVRQAKNEIDATVARIAATHDQLGRIARASYQEGGMSELAVVLQAQSPDEFASRLVLVQNAMRSEGAVLVGLDEDRANLSAQRATLVARRKQVSAMKRRQEALVEQITSLEAQAVEAQMAVESLISERATAVAAVEREKAAEEVRYNQMQAESARLGKVLAARAAAAKAAAARARAAGRSTSAVTGSGTLSWPVSAGITSPYGMRTHPVTGIYKLHDGTDFGVGCGTPVRAAASGTVIQTANVPGYGNQLVIDHGIARGAGVATSYNHLMSFAAGYGARVSRGQVIGYSGGGEGMSGAGYSTGCHLHLMVYVNGGTADPMGWL